MKKQTILYLGLAAFLLSLTTFATNYIQIKRKSPKEVALLFLNAMDQKKYEEAKLYGTKATDDFIDEIKAMDTQPYDPSQKKTFQVVNEEIKDWKAIVTYIEVGKGEGTLMLEEENKQWLVVYTKESIFQD